MRQAIPTELYLLSLQQKEIEVVCSEISVRDPQGRVERKPSLPFSDESSECELRAGEQRTDSE